MFGVSSKPTLPPQNLIRLHLISIHFIHLGHNTKAPYLQIYNIRIWTIHVMLENGQISIVGKWAKIYDFQISLLQHTTVMHAYVFGVVNMNNHGEVA